MTVTIDFYFLSDLVILIYFVLLKIFSDYSVQTAVSKKILLVNSICNQMLRVWCTEPPPFTTHWSLCPINYSVADCTALCCTALHSNALQGTTLHCSLWYCSAWQHYSNATIALYCTLHNYLYCTALNCWGPNFTALHTAEL